MNSIKSHVALILFFFLLNSIKAQTNISGVINSYAKVTSISTSPYTDSVTIANAAGFAAGDSILIIQMQGADINLTNTALFGNINNYNNSGNYEFAKIASINGNNIHFTSPLIKSYSVAGHVQLVTKPVYTNAIVTGVLNALPWNGSTGGVLTFSIINTLTLNNDINVSGLGFRGGSASPNYYTTWFYDFCFSISPGRGGKKGEAIAEYCINKEFGRGAQASGGGGGNDINNGAGGGGYYGEGGHGGNNFYAPDTLWGLRGRSIVNGINQGKLFFGSGGGGGHQNNNMGSHGSNGGGIIMIYANTILGNNHFIKSNGVDVTFVATIDGAGGGGSGGTVLVDAITFNTNLYIEAKGGKGGDQNYPPQCHGNGGGGGGGVILYTYQSFPNNVFTNVSGGLQGAGVCNNSASLNAAPGKPGGIIFNWYVPVQLPISLLNFEGTCNKNKVELSWITASEVNNDYFEIQRSTDGTDFSSIGHVHGHGNSTSTISYSFIDIDPGQIDNYYRLMQVDFDGRSTFFDPIFLNCNSENREPVTISPNPFRNSFTLNFNSDRARSYSFSLMNQYGVVVWNKIVNCRIGLNSIKFNNLDELPSGIYIALLLDEQRRIIKLVKN